MPLAILDSALFLILGMILGWVLTRAYGKPPRPETDASVKLVRTARTADGHEETRLLINDAVILSASNDGVRLAEYADEVEQLEAVAARLAASMGVTVEFSRIGPHSAGDQNGIPVRSLPRQEPEDLEPRRARLDADHRDG